MKIEEKLNVKKVIAQSKKNQKKLGNLFEALKGSELTEKEETNLNTQLKEMEHLALSIKEELAKSDK